MSDDKLWKSSERGSESALGVRQRFTSTLDPVRELDRCWRKNVRHTLAPTKSVSCHWFSSISVKCVRATDRHVSRVCRQPRELTGPRTRVDERWCTYIRVSYILHIQHPPLFRRELLQRCLRNEIRPGESLKSSNGSSHPSTRASWGRRFGVVFVFETARDDAYPSLNLHEFHEIFVTFR